MNPLQSRGIQKTGGIADDHPSISGEGWQRPPSAIGKRLGAVAEHLAAGEQSCNERMLLERLQHMLRIEARVAIIEAGNEAKRHDVFFRAIPFRAVHPRAAVF